MDNIVWAEQPRHGTVAVLVDEEDGKPMIFLEFSAGAERRSLMLKPEDALHFARVLADKADGILRRYPLRGVSDTLAGGED